SARHMSRLKGRFEKEGWDGIRDHRGSRPRRRRIGLKTIARLCRLYARDYQGFSVQHFYEHAVEHHGFRLSYTWTRLILQEAGLVAKAPSRGKYRRKRERRPLVGMLVHLDASTHAWLAGLPPQDLVVALDDADGRILYARFWPQEGTASTFAALEHVLRYQGRFAELYTDRGSHFCYTPSAGAAPDVTHATQVQQALRALGIRHILARSPEARGRSERAFGTLQGRLPQELRLHGITDYAAANTYLTTTFVPAFNRRFTVRPAQPGSAFVPVAGIDLRLVLSARHDREPGRTQRPRGRHLKAADAQDRRERSRRRPAETQVPAPGGHVGARETPDAERGEAAGECARRVAEADARPARIRDEGDRRYGRAEELAGAVLEDERDVLPRQPELRQ